MNPLLPSEVPPVPSANRLSTAAFAGCLAFVALLLAGSWWAWQHPPASPLAHEPLVLILFVPGLVLFFSMFFRLDPKWAWAPRGSNLQRKKRFYPSPWIFVFLMAAGFHIVMIRAYLGLHLPVSVPQFIFSSEGVVFILLGNQLGKCRINFWFRIRTPWTRHSELAWNRTNRLAGWLMVVSGVVLVATPFTPFHTHTFWFVVCVGGWLVTIWTYSYLLWRSDPHRIEFKFNWKEAFKP